MNEVKVIIRERKYSAFGTAFEVESGEELANLLEMAADGGNEIAEIQLDTVYVGNNEEAE